MRVRAKRHKHEAFYVVKRRIISKVYYDSPNYLHIYDLREKSVTSWKSNKSFDKLHLTQVTNSAFDGEGKKIHYIMIYGNVLSSLPVIISIVRLVFVFMGTADNK